MVLGKHQVWPQIPPAIQTGLPDLLLTCNSMKGNGGEIILKYSFKNLRNTIDKIRKKIPSAYSDRFTRLVVNLAESQLNEWRGRGYKITFRI